LVGGELWSRKGLNLPGIDLGMSAFTKRDHECLKFSLEQGVDAVSQSFVESAADIMAVREAASALGHNPFIIAKLERSRARAHLEDILEAADGIMVARGDLGVEIPIEQIAIAQKELIRRANLLGKPVITATQMLESMTANRRPTRAESTDVANAILDGTDCVMLSEESAMGSYPVEATAMLAKIAAATEPKRPGLRAREELKQCGLDCNVRLTDLLALSVETAVETVSPAAVIVPSLTGTSARSITRFRLPIWIAAVSPDEGTCQKLQFSYGVYPLHVPETVENWNLFARDWVQSHGLEGDLVILSAGPSPEHPQANNRMEIIDLRRG
jgi:pyruvate kinase